MTLGTTLTVVVTFLLLLAATLSSAHGPHSTTLSHRGRPIKVYDIFPGQVSFGWRIVRNSSLSSFQGYDERVAEAHGHHDEHTVAPPSPSSIDGGTTNQGEDLVEMLWVIKGDQYGAVGFSKKAADGPIVAAYAYPRSDGGKAECQDIIGVGVDVHVRLQKTKLMNLSHHDDDVVVIACTTTLSHMNHQLPPLLSESPAEEEEEPPITRLIFARGPWNPSSNFPRVHPTSTREHIAILYVHLELAKFAHHHSDFPNSLTVCVFLATLTLPWVIAVTRRLCCSKNGYTLVSKPSVIASRVVKFGVLLFVEGSWLVLFLVHYSYAQKELQSAPVARALGWSSRYLMMVLLLPTCKHFGYGSLLGVSFEKFIALHVVLGVQIFAVISLHLFLMTWQYGRDTSITFLGERPNQGIAFLLSWNTHHHNLAAVFCYIFLLCVAIPAIFLRRSLYWFFRYTHLFTFAVLLFGSIHETTLLYSVALPLLNYVIDVAHRFYVQLFAAKPTLISADYFPSCRVTRVRVQCNGRFALSVSPMQHCLMCFPKLSAIPHPFTIAGVADDGTLTFYIKGNIHRSSSLRAIEEDEEEGEDGDDIVAKPPKLAAWTHRLAYHAHRSGKRGQVEGTDAWPPLALQGLTLTGPFGGREASGMLCADFAPHTLILASGGVGVTPMLSVLSFLARTAKAPNAFDIGDDAGFDNDAIELSSTKTGGDDAASVRSEGSTSSSTRMGGGSRRHRHFGIPSLRKVRFVWALREEGMLDVMRAEIVIALLKLVEVGIEVEATAHLTKISSAVRVYADSNTEREDGNKPMMDEQGKSPAKNASISSPFDDERGAAAADDDATHKVGSFTNSSATKTDRLVRVLTESLSAPSYHLKVKPGRPFLDGIFRQYGHSEDEAAAGATRNANVCVFACGPESLTKQCAALAHGNGFSFHEESFLL